MRLELLHTLLALAVSHDLDIIQFDVTSAYLHRNLKEEVYIKQPDGYVADRKEDWVWCLKKGLYGLVQAGHTWNEELDSHMVGARYAATVKDTAKGSWGCNDFVASGFWVDNFINVGAGGELGKLATFHHHRLWSCSQLNPPVLVSGAVAHPPCLLTMDQRVSNVTKTCEARVITHNKLNHHV